MKKLILLLFIIICINLLAGQIYIEVKKETNGSSMTKLPHIEETFVINNFIYTPEVNLYFSLDRGATMPNHHSFDINNNFGVYKNNFFITFSLGTRYYFSENSDNIQEGFNWYNTFRIGTYF